MNETHVGLDFGTSQTKVCIYNSNLNVREFIKFQNSSYFLPSVIVKKTDDTFSYGDESVFGLKYRYFKMSPAEDDQLVQATNEDLDGKLKNESLEYYKKYSTNTEISSEILVVLYLCYVILYVKKNVNDRSGVPITGKLQRTGAQKIKFASSFSINLGIPTEWNNPIHFKRKIKFQSLLLTAVQLSNEYHEMRDYLNEIQDSLLKKIYIINNRHTSELADKTIDQRVKIIKNWLDTYTLSVTPESAAGVNYLLQTCRLEDGSYATIDIGGGTSDIAIFEVKNNQLSTYYCSESVEIACNDFYVEYGKQYFNRNFITFDEIKEIEKIVREENNLSQLFYERAISNVRGFNGKEGIDFAIRKTFYRKFYINVFQINKIKAYKAKNHLDDRPVIIFGGGANLVGFCSGSYCFFKGNNPYGIDDRSFRATPINMYKEELSVGNKDSSVNNYLNQLVLSLGLTYPQINNNFAYFNYDTILPSTPIRDDAYFYYDLQAAVYK